MQTTINNKVIEISEEELSLKLIDFLRENLNLTGTKNGCDIGACGSCTILVNENPVRSCIKKVSDIIDKKVLTIEGMENEDGTVHHLQQSFIDHGAIQCGFCTPGMVLVSHAFLLKTKNPTRAEVQKAIKPNLCRCTGYQQIIDAILFAAKKY